MSGKLAFSTFIARLLLAGIKNQDKSNISPKQPWLTCNKKERMDIVFQPTEKEKVWLIVFFNREEWGVEEGWFPCCEMFPCHSDRTHSSPLHCGMCYEAFLKKGVIVQKQHYVQEEWDKYSAVSALLRSYLLRHMWKDFRISSMWTIKCMYILKFLFQLSMNEFPNFLNSSISFSWIE